MANNGNPFLQVWGIANGKPPEISTVKFGKIDDKQSYHWSLAQAEFFSDCADGNAAWSESDYLAMWHLWGKGRLRRVNEPVEAITNLANTAISARPAAPRDLAECHSLRRPGS